MTAVQKICIIAICAVLCAIAFTAVYAFFDADTLTSEKENRTLAEAPEYSLAEWFSGDFDEDLDDYLSDHVAFRNELIDITRDMEDWMEYEASIRIVDRKHKKPHND